MMKCWLEDWLDFWFPPPRETGGLVNMGTDSVSERAEQSTAADTKAPGEIAPFPKPPEFYLRPELIPIKEPDKDAVREAERVVRSKR